MNTQTSPSVSQASAPPSAETESAFTPAGPSPQHSITPALPAQPFDLPEAEPWPHPVDGKALLDALVLLLTRFVVLPQWAAQTLALWVMHTFAFHLRDATTYIGVESPEKRCGKTTLLTVLSELVSRPVVAANISPPAFFRVIEETQPTLLIDEADTLLLGNDELRGILNSGYKRKTAYVVRVANQPATHAPPTADESEESGDLTTPGSPLANCPPSPLALRTSHFPTRLARFSCWCPKMMAAIGRLPDTLADRCIVIRMQRKTPREQCERLRTLEAAPLRRQCARFVLDHAQEIAVARPEIPASLNDRAADIWEPLLALADLAGGDWPQIARQAAVGLTTSAQESSPVGSLLLDILIAFARAGDSRLFSRNLVASLNCCTDRPWLDLRKGREITELWLARQLRPYGVRPKTIWIGDDHAKGYSEGDFTDVFRRYISKAEFDAFVAENRRSAQPPSTPAPSQSPAPAPSI